MTTPMQLARQTSQPVLPALTVIGPLPVGLPRRFSNESLKGPAGLSVLGVKAATASMDDFYLPTKFLPPIIFRGEPNSRPRLLPRRGPPGTHDLALCCGVLRRIKEREPYVSTGSEVQSWNIMLPKYDKSQMNGTGDRSREEVPLDAADLDVFLLEGWMLG
ncbi:uncharacterized protein EMH_0025080 [Eimeria mitis]|uniref:Uncharacterized protein n=1 Tax=Eimeria mitis TaxID=44415 RepID=U6KIJ7_9EIME|nr:uncharacterized protein EMH_0025080 [Eimeria mitis]CDJ35288.1 hypothetical protein EMH_0025080 [Eimeria mitis]